jgi:hypothetical protein
MKGDEEQLGGVDMLKGIECVFDELARRRL